MIGGGLEFFTHDHPVQQSDGVFMLDVTLPRQGPYMAIAEFLPEGGTPQMFQQAFTTGEAFARRANPALDLGAKTVDGVRVTLDAAQAAAGEPTRLAFSIAHADTGTPVTDLEPYLGASAHLLVVPVDLTEAMHGHPTEDATGPGVAFAPLIPRTGRYKASVQFQRAGRVTTAAFVFDVAGTRAGGVALTGSVAVSLSGRRSRLPFDPTANLIGRASHRRATATESERLRRLGVGIDPALDPCQGAPLNAGDVHVANGRVHD